MYRYGHYQALFDELKRRLPNFLHKELPTPTEIEEFVGGKHDLIILDDLMQDVLGS